METWHENGRKRFRKYYRLGIEHGNQEIHYENGKIREVSEKVDGKYHGKFMGYYKEFKDGAIQKECHYIRGKLHGPFRGYYPSGFPMVTCTYDMDLLDGEWTRFFDQENTDTPPSVQEMGRYQSGIKQGDWSTYYPSGVLYTRGSYMDKKFRGEWTIYHPNGIIKQRGNYLSGLAQGEFSMYYESGKLKNKGMYQDDQKTGIWITYYESGKSMTEIPFVKGKRHGSARAYDEKGNVVESRYYEHGKITE